MAQFTPEQKEILQTNPFTLFVNDKQIRFTLEFKKYLLAEREKNGTPWKEVFRKAGYDPEILGEARITKAVSSIRKQAASERGLHETVPQKKQFKLEEKQNEKKAIHELQTEVIRLRQEIEFLKKIQMLKTLEENDN